MQYIVQNYARYYMKVVFFSTNFHYFIIYEMKITVARRKVNLIIAYLAPYLLSQYQRY